MDKSNEPMRLSKLMSQRGLCSRREADDLIAKGMVSVDGVVVDQLGSKVSPDVDIQINKSGKKILSRKLTIILHKPVGFVSSQPEDGHDPAIQLITRDNQFLQKNESPIRDLNLKGMAPAGRLDIDSKGLLVFTQDGTVAKTIIGENSEIEKEYLVWVHGSIAPDILDQLCFGLSLDGQQLKQAVVSMVAPQRLKFILKEGRKRQIRRMCEAVGLKVTSLKRIRVGQVRLGNLPEGTWRILKPGENF